MLSDRVGSGLVDVLGKPQRRLLLLGTPGVRGWLKMPPGFGGVGTLGQPGRGALGRPGIGRLGVGGTGRGMDDGPDGPGSRLHFNDINSSTQQRFSTLLRYGFEPRNLLGEPKCQSGFLLDWYSSPAPPR